MKKTSLKNLRLEAKDILKKDDLKFIIGGSGQNCTVNCLNGFSWPVQNCNPQVFETGPCFLQGGPSNTTLSCSCS